MHNRDWHDTLRLASSRNEIVALSTRIQGNAVCGTAPCRNPTELLRDACRMVVVPGGALPGCRGVRDHQHSGDTADHGPSRLLKMDEDDLMREVVYLLASKHHMYQQCRDRYYSVIWAVPYRTRADDVPAEVIGLPLLRTCMCTSLALCNNLDQQPRY